MTLKRAHKILLNLPRAGKRAVLWGIDLLCLPLAYLLADTLRFSRIATPPYDWTLLASVALVTVAFLQLMGFYRLVLRYLDASMFRSLLPALGLAIPMLYTLAYLDPT